MDGMELYGQLNDKLRDLDEANDRMRESGYRKAETEKEYRIAKAKKILKLRTEGFPVTICQDVAMGCVEVANRLRTSGSTVTARRSNTRPTARPCGASKRRCAS